MPVVTSVLLASVAGDLLLEGGKALASKAAEKVGIDAWSELRGRLGGHFALPKNHAALEARR